MRLPIKLLSVLFSVMLLNCPGASGGIGLIHKKPGGGAAKDSSLRRVATDNSSIAVRKPDASKQEDLFSDKEFLYDKVPPPPKTPWQRFWDWVERKLGDIFTSEGFSSFWDVFQYLLLAAAVGLIIWLILKNELRSAFYGKSASATIGFKEVNENIHEIDFAKLIGEAVEQRNYRRAVRLSFLRALKQLSDRELIRWKADKTNYDYYLELKDSPVQGAFRSLSFLYEYVWYGDFGITEEMYKVTSGKFKEFNEQLMH